MNEKAEKKIHWRTVGVAVLISITLGSSIGHVQNLRNDMNHKLFLSKKTIDEQQRQIDELKRELEVLKRK